MKETSPEYDRFIFFNINQNNNKLGSGITPTSDQIHPTSGSSNWPNWDPHNYNVYINTHRGYGRPVQKVEPQVPGWIYYEHVYFLNINV